MRSAALLSSVFAIGALGGVINVNKRDIVTETQVNVVTKVVMVSASGSAPVPTSVPAVPTSIPAPAPAPAPVKHHHGHKHTHKQPSANDQSNSESSVEPSTTPETTPQAQPQPVAAPQGLNAYASVAVQQHNLHRQNNSAPAVTWDDDLAQSAAALAAGCIFMHNVDLGPASSYGQNIASAFPATGSTANQVKSVITDMWYNGEVNVFTPFFGEANPDMSLFDSFGHFTQVVWKDTQKIGCATQNCPALGYFTVCNYSPPGNYADKYAENVLPSIGEPSIAG